MKKYYLPLLALIGLIILWQVATKQQSATGPVQPAAPAQQIDQAARQGAATNEVSSSLEKEQAQPLPPQETSLVAAKEVKTPNLTAQPKQEQRDTTVTAAEVTKETQEAAPEPEAKPELQHDGSPALAPVPEPQPRSEPAEAVKNAPQKPANTAKVPQLSTGKEAKKAANAGTAPMDPNVEMVRIQEVDFPVPKPWAGNRVRVPYDTAENLVLIPTELTLDAMEIALRKEALEKLELMAAAAREEGVILQVDSGYRSANYQREIYERRLGEGQSFERIARHTAPPGYSGHALGTAVDFHPSSSGFQNTRAYRWLKQHARKYGFRETYYKGNAFGMSWEPWHWEYRLPRKKPAERPAGIEVAARQDSAEKKEHVQKSNKINALPPAATASPEPLKQAANSKEAARKPEIPEPQKEAANKEPTGQTGL